MSKQRKDLLIKLDRQTSYKCGLKHKHCLLCKETAVEPHHWIHGRSNTKYRHDDRNIIGLCRYHHMRVHSGHINYEILKERALYYDLIGWNELIEIENDNSINKITTAELKDKLI